MFIDQTSQDALADDQAGATRCSVCSAEPATFADIATYSLGSIVMGAGDYAKSGAAGGTRVLTSTPPAGSVYSAAGTAAFLAYDDGVNLKRTVDLSASKTVNAGDAIDIAAHNLNIPQPTAV